MSSTGTRKPYVDGKGAVHWPVLFVYPESSYEDCIEDVEEDETFEVRPCHHDRSRLLA